MTRIVGGSAGGRPIATPRGSGTRPTSERVRAALFNTVGSILGAGDGGGSAGLRVLDLYAGSGALGLEALSRGATSALLVESDSTAAGVARANARALGLAGATVCAGAVERIVASARWCRPVDLVLADPPYELPAAHLAGILARLAEGWLVPDALIVIERSGRDEPWAWPDPIEAVQHRSYGDTALWYGRRP